MELQQRRNAIVLIISFPASRWLETESREHLLFFNYMYISLLKNMALWVLVRRCIRPDASSP